MSEGENLIRKRRVRGGHKASVSRTLTLVKEALQTPEANASKLKQYLRLLRDKLSIIETLDSEILDLVTGEEEITEEIGQADIFRETVEVAIIDIEAALAIDEQANRPTSPVTRERTPETRRETTVTEHDPQNNTEGTVQENQSPSRLRSTTSSPSPVPSTTQTQNLEQTSPRRDQTAVKSRETKIRLPKITLKKFNGDITLWTSFWDSFESSIHLNSELTDIDKFNYLRSLLEHSALEAISGLTLSSVNYEEAVAILKKRFGNKQNQITKHMEALLGLEAVTSPRDLKNLRQLYDAVESHVRCLKSLGVTSSSYGSLLSSILMKKIPSELCLIISRETVKESWDLDSMMKVFEQELEARERAAVETGNAVLKRPAKEHPTTAALLTGQSPASCCYCGGTHQSQQCESVSSTEQRKQLLRQTGRCFVCLKRGHLGRDCRSSSRCTHCSARHHNSICTSSRPVGTPHVKPAQSTSTHHAPTTPASSSAVRPPQTSVHSMHVSTRMPILLQTARTRASNPHNSGLSAQVRIILDSGSQRSYVTDRLKEVLQLTSEHTESMLVKTFASEEQRMFKCDTVRIRLGSRDGKGIDLKLVSVPLICDPLCGQPVVCAVSRFPEISHLDLADTATCSDNLNVDILIGCDYYWQIVTGETIRVIGGPAAVRTIFGWVLSGPLKGLPCQASDVTLLNTSLVLRVDSNPVEPQHFDLETQLKKFWDLETLGIQNEEPSLYDRFLENVSHDGTRYEVKLPWKEFHADLPDNLDLSQRRFSGLLKRLRCHPEILQEYDAIIRNQLESNIVERVEDPFSPTAVKVHYIPHHPVIRKDKATTKLRIVYDASAKTNGVSLNDCVYAGPAFGQCILNILLRFRVPKVAFTGDIEKAFLMISVAQEDRDVLRFLWIDDIDRDLPQMVVLRFTRVPFGVSSSPFLLNATIRHHMMRYINEDPGFVEKILQSIYVDDIVSGADDVNDAYDLYTKAKRILQDGGFNLRKLTSNSASLTNRANEPSLKEACPVSSQVAEDNETYADNVLGDKQTTVAQDHHRVLGVNWDLSEDHLVFDITPLLQLMSQSEPTKRNIISLSSRIYDPLGIISPVSVQLKIFAQKLCEAKIDWDEAVSGELLRRWNALRSNICDLKSITIPRCYFQCICRNSATCNLIGFCDASLQAYAAAVYLMIRKDSGCNVCLVASKTRVAPLHGQTIPRLELISALLLAKLLSKVSLALGSELSLGLPRCYTDSKIALYWIRGENREWKQFVQNRVVSIRSLLPSQFWHHCDGISNPADIPSRGRSLSDSATLKLWINGPEWLHTDAECEQPSEVMPEECLAEMKNLTSIESPRTQALLAAECNIATPLLRCEDFSTLKRLLRITGYVMAFVDRLKQKISHSHNDTWSLEESISRAESYWIKISQQQLVSIKEFHIWKHQFGLFVDHNGVWRCKGRLDNANIPETAKFPILLNSKHHFTLLVVQNCHLKVMHSGVKETLTELRSRYWLIKGRQYIRRVLHNCSICKRFISRPYTTPPPPPLPSMRVQDAPPFTHVGVDFAGPLYIKDAKKVWICLYTCCATRAVHLEVVPNMTTEAFINCFRRFTARRGFPSRVLSDNGKTFKSAHRVLLNLLAQPTVTKYFLDTRIKWTFNLERAPWWGGMFERLVKSMKQCLKRTVGSAKLTSDELLTVVTEVEATLNSRPLSYISTEDLEEPLTPSHLLVGRRLCSYPDPFFEVNYQDPEYEVTTEDLTRRIRYLNSVLNHFWMRWRREYLLELRECHRYAKWTSPGSNQIAVGDVVLLYDENLPRTLWRLALVEGLIQGKDGLVRGARIRTRSGNDKFLILQRPIQHLYPLEIRCDEMPVSNTVSTGPSDDNDGGATFKNFEGRIRRQASLKARERIRSCIEQYGVD